MQETGKKGKMQRRTAGQGRARAVAIAAALALVGLFAFSGQAALAAPPTIEGETISEATFGSATLEANVNPKGVITRYRFEYGLGKCPTGCTATDEVQLAAVSTPIAVKTTVKGLNPATAYHWRITATNVSNEDASSEDMLFATYAKAQSGPADSRKYEQVSPVDKNGGDAVGKAALVKASEDGSAISFGSTFGIPGGVGSQGLPLYLAKRYGEGTDASWSTQGLFPPENLGERAVILGWPPDFSEVYATVTRLGEPRTKAFLVEPADGSEPLMAAPYVAGPEYGYVGTSADGRTVLFEAEAKLPPEEGAEPIAAALTGYPNIYAWDRETGELRLASVLKEGESPARGANAGAKGAGTYLRDSRAVTEDGSVFFTARGTGQLYERIDPTLPAGKAVVDSEGEEVCEAGKSCTIHISASEKTNGEGPGGNDSAGPQPAHFWAASKDGSKVFFTSHEKLTNDASTGPEQPAAAIGRAGLEGESPDESLLPTHALGIATDSEHLYWANPATGTIGRSDLNGSPGSVEENFVAPGEVEFEYEEEIKPGVFNTIKESVPTKPRYVAVDSEYVYWTNTGRTDENGRPIEGGGTIGRAPLDEPEHVEAAFIRGASDPQGVAVGEGGYLYWVNQGAKSIGRAKAEDGGEVEQGFFQIFSQRVPYALAIDATHIYFTSNDTSNNVSDIEVLPLAGGSVEGTLFFESAGLRGILLDGANLYWAFPGKKSIGKVPIADVKSGSCEAIPACEQKFIELAGSPEGVATDGTHLLWSVNGESPTNPGNDLYRYDAKAKASEQLTDLSVEGVPGEKDGAEAQGVIGTSEDGSILYFAANGVLATNEGALGSHATRGDCEGAGDQSEGNCNLYVWREAGGKSSFIAPLKLSGIFGDFYDWVQVDVGLGGIYRPRPSFVSPAGQTLLFRSAGQLTPYESDGTPELYRYRVGQKGVLCVSCDPSGEAPEGSPSVGEVEFPQMAPLYQGVFSNHILATSGDRVVFEAQGSLAEGDDNKSADVYEWETPGTGGCEEGDAGWSPLDGGCVLLLSGGKEGTSSELADASTSGDDVFFFTRQQLVGQDEDELKDVYDAKVGGGIASQNPPPVPCKSPEACRPPVPQPPPEGALGSANFQGPPNPKPKRGKAKPKHHKHKKKKRAQAKRRAGQ